MKKLTLAIIFAVFCSSVSGCATLKESRGDNLEDTRKLIYDTQGALRNIHEKTFIIKQDSSPR